MRPGAAWRPRSPARPSRRSHRARTSADRRARWPCRPMPWSPRRAPRPRRRIASQWSPLGWRRSPRRAPRPEVAAPPGSHRPRCPEGAHPPPARTQPRPGDRACAGEQAIATRTAAHPARLSAAGRRRRQQDHAGAIGRHASHHADRDRPSGRSSGNATHATNSCSSTARSATRVRSRDGRGSNR